MSIEGKARRESCLPKAQTCTCCSAILGTDRHGFVLLRGESLRHITVWRGLVVTVGPWRAVWVVHVPPSHGPVGSEQLCTAAHERDPLDSTKRPLKLAFSEAIVGPIVAPREFCSGVPHSTSDASRCAGIQGHYTRLSWAPQTARGRPDRSQGK